MKKSTTRNSSKKTNYNYEKSGQNWKKNPLFQPGETHIRMTRDKWTPERLEKTRQRMIKWNKSKAGRKMASKRSKKMLSDEATKQRWMDGRDRWHEEHPEARQKHAETFFQPHNEARHIKAQKRHSIERAREMYRTSNVKPIIKPLPNQSDEYYDALDDFFAEGF